MSFISGFLGLGSSIEDGTLVEPTLVGGYAEQPIYFEEIALSITVNAVSLSFGPTLNLWGELTAFGIFDAYGNMAFSGELAVPINPAIGTYVNIAAGTVLLNFASGGGGGSLLPATTSTLGGVIVPIGSGISVDVNGRIALSASGLPTSPVGLSVGSIWNNGGLIGVVTSAT